MLWHPVPSKHFIKDNAVYEHLLSQFSHGLRGDNKSEYHSNAAPKSVNNSCYSADEQGEIKDVEYLN